MNRFLLKYLLPISLIILNSTVNAQKFDTVLARLDTEYPKEKIYVHFDRSVYNPGETIWMKAYLITGTMLSPISTTMYFDLVDEGGKVIDRKTAPIAMGGAAAAFDLPAGFSGSVVYARVYTKWMLNFEEEYLFLKTIPIAGTAKTESKTASKETGPLIHFFPEGGDLINGLVSRVAFKATDRSGLPIRAAGVIKNKKGEHVTEFNSVHDGMGIFSILPDLAEKYSVTWKDDKGKTYQAELPAVKKEGVSLQVYKGDSGVRFVVTRTPNMVLPNSSVYIVAQMNQQLIYRAKGSLEKTSGISSVIPLAGLPAGIAQITIFSEDHKPLAERIVFVNSDDYYFITDLNAALKNVQKRGRNVIQIDVPDTLECNLSVSVTDADLNPIRKSEDDIFSKILLTSEIKGYVHNPAYYFSSTVDSVLNHLDLVMMTNGWRRFHWPEVLAGKYPQIKYMPENYLVIDGNISGLSQNVLSRQEVTAILQLKDGQQQLLNVPVENGKFTIPGLLFYDTAKVYYQFNNDKNKVLTSAAVFQMKNNLMPEALKSSPDPVLAARLEKPDSAVLNKNKQIAGLVASLEEEKRKVQTLESVVVTAKQKSKETLMDEEYTSGLFRGGDGYTFIMDELNTNNSMTVLQYLQGRVPGLQITVSGPNATLSWRGASPALFMNEMPGDVSMIQTIPMSDVAMVKVFRPPFMGAFGGGAGGAIAIYTKKGEARSADMKGLDNSSIAGYSPIKEFFSPDYSKVSEGDNDADYRTTLYWNPYVLTTKNKRRVILSFYNNDISKRFRVVIEGVNENGKLTRIEKVFQ